MTNKQRVFIEEYLKCWNATEAARQAGYAYPNVEGPKNLVKPSISEQIQARLNEIKMSADEVLTRLADQARGDLGDFDDVVSGRVELKDHPKSALIKKLKVKMLAGGEDEGLIKFTEIELYDAHAALVDLGRHHGLFTDKVEHSGSVTGNLVILPGKDHDGDQADTE